MIVATIDRWAAVQNVMDRGIRGKVSVRCVVFRAVSFRDDALYLSDGA